MLALKKCLSEFRLLSGIIPQVRFLSTQKATKETPFENAEDKETHFGFSTVKESEKAKKVHEVFESVAERYDIMNDVMSMGIHRLWKDEMVRELGAGAETRLLDAAGGTGDIAFRVVRASSAARVTVCDVNEAMLTEGQRRAENQLPPEAASRLEWRVGDAEHLPFADGTFTAYTIAFGIRNVTHMESVLADAYRVLAPGGRFLCLEFSRVDSDSLRWLYDRYSLHVIPVLGQIVAGQWRPYQYLVESIRRFPPQDQFADMIERAGFRAVTYRNFTAGVVALHSGFKL